MKKVLWFDVETTGTDPSRHGIIQFACLVEINGEVEDSFEIKMQPHSGAIISEEALLVNGISNEVIGSFISHSEAYRQIDEFLSRYVSRFDRNDKFYPAGYNVQFDLEFLGRMFKRFDQYGIGSFMNWRFIDPLPILYYMEYMGIIGLPNYKLKTVCNHFGIKLDSAHDALADVKATRELMMLFKKYISFTLFSAKS